MTLEEQLTEALRRITELERQVAALATDLNVIQRYVADRLG